MTIFILATQNVYLYTICEYNILTLQFFLYVVNGHLWIFINYLVRQ